jgi:adenosylcobinamide-GDP ribazoletransferase
VSRGPRAWIHHVAVAVQFLTRVPLRVRFAEGDLRSATGAFPLVGVLVAGVGVAVRWALDGPLGTVPATVAALAAMVLLTGAFHEDGFADAADGLWGGRTPEDRLRIMRDSRLGTYGTLALILLIAVKITLLGPLAPSVFARALVAAEVLGRASSLPLMAILPPAPGSLVTLAGPPSVLAGVVAAATCAAAVVGFGMWAWLPLTLTIAVIAAWVPLVRRKIGGINGDLLGAANQLVVLAVIAAGVATLP